MIALFIRQMTRLISEPIVTISDSVETFSQGDQEINLPDSLYRREDEIGILSWGLKMMSRRITEYIEAVQTNNIALNKEIDKRQGVQSQLEMILELLSGTDEGIFILNNEFFCIYNNAAFSRIIGIPEEAIPTLNLSENNILINAPLVDSLQMNPIWSGEIE